MEWRDKNFSFNECLWKIKFLMSTIKEMEIKSFLNLVILFKSCDSSEQLLQIEVIGLFNWLFCYQSL